MTAAQTGSVGFLAFLVGTNLFVDGYRRLGAAIELGAAFLLVGAIVWAVSNRLSRQ